MSQRIVTYCDTHQARDEDVLGQPYDVAFRVNGGQFRFMTIDLCEDCAKPLGDVIKEVADSGREFQGDPVEAIRTKRGPYKARKSRAVQPVDTGFVCDVCSKTFQKAQGLASHRRISHPDEPYKTVAEIVGRADG